MSEQQFVVFRLGRERYGADIRHISSISEPADITVVPNADSRIEGIINLRGDIIPLVNLKKQFNYADTQASEDSRIIIYRTENGVVGFHVDDASQVIHIDTADIDPTPEILRGTDREFIAGIGKVNGEIIILLDLDHLTDSIAAANHTRRI